MSDIHNASLGDCFYCHTNTPRFGFWGELREAVRADMTLVEAIFLHNNNFDFEKRDIILLHEMCHQVLAILAIYNASLRHLLPEMDSHNILKPQGYNGFSRSELYVSVLEDYLMRGYNWTMQPKKADRKQFIQKSLDKNGNFTDGVFFRDELNPWLLAHHSIDKITIHELRKKHQYNPYELIALAKPHREKLSRSFMRTRRKHKNKNGETLKPASILTKKELGFLFDSILPLAQFLGNTYISANENSDCRYETVWGTIKIRDFHRVIGGEEAANAYFKLCGVDDYTKTKEIAPVAAVA